MKLGMMAARSHRWDVIAVIGAGVAASLSMFAWWDYLAFGLGEVLLALWQALPFVLVGLLRSRRTLSAVGTIVATGLLALVTIWVQISIYHDESSTAVIAFLFTPVYLCAAVLIAWIVDLTVRRWGTSGRRSSDL